MLLRSVSRRVLGAGRTLCVCARRAVSEKMLVKLTGPTRRALLWGDRSRRSIARGIAGHKGVCSLIFVSV